MGLQSKIERKLRPVALRTDAHTLLRVQKKPSKHPKCQKSTLKNKNFEKNKKVPLDILETILKWVYNPKLVKKLRAVALWTDGQTDRLFASPGKLTTITNL